MKLRDNESFLEQFNPLLDADWTDYSDYMRLRRNLIALLDAAAAAFYPEEQLSKIAAEEVRLEIVDRETGRLYQRDLPLEFLETDNGIRLTGENASGAFSEIVFLSQQSLEKIKDLTGKGPDKPRCKE